MWVQLMYIPVLVTWIIKVWDHVSKGIMEGSLLISILQNNSNNKSNNITNYNIDIIT